MLAGVEIMIQKTFLHRLFFGKTKTFSPIVGSLSTMPINVAGLSVLNSVSSKKEKYLSSQRGIWELIRDMMEGGGHSPMPTTDVHSGKKDVTEINTRNP